MSAPLRPMLSSDIVPAERRTSDEEECERGSPPVLDASPEPVPVPNSSLSRSSGTVSTNTVAVEEKCGTPELLAEPEHVLSTLVAV